ncbi:MAG: outer membrane lipoprotein carrier protein LolA [Gemmatimonadaceae bacterium]
MVAPLLAGVALVLAGWSPRTATAQERVPHRRPTPEATIDRAVAAYARVRTVHASFEQTLTNPLTGTTSTAHGDFRQKRPALLSVRFADPAGDRIVADGENVWLFLPSSAPGQVIRAPARGRGADGFDLTARFLDAPRTRYSLTDAGRSSLDGHPTHAVQLIPRADQPFVKATVWIDDSDALIRQFEVEEGSGLIRRVRLTTIAINVPMDRRTFSFAPPPGVRIIDQAALMGVR